MPNSFPTTSLQDLARRTGKTASRERAPTEEGSSTGTRPAPTEAQTVSPSGGAEISGRPRFSCKAIEAYKDSGIPCPPAAQAADERRNTVSCCRPCFGLRILAPKEIAGTVPFAKEMLLRPSRRYPDLAGDKKKVRPYDLTLKRRLPTLPRENRSTIGVSELNFSVRNGKRWNLTAITT